MSYGYGGPPAFGPPPRALPWYQRTGWIVALLIFVAPIGIFLMWRFTNWARPVRIAVSAVCGLLFLAAAVGSANGSDGKGGEAVSPATASASASPSASPTPSATPTAATASAAPATTAPVTSAPPETSAPATTTPAPAQPATAPAVPPANPPAAPRTEAPRPPATTRAPAPAPATTQAPEPGSIAGVHPGAFCSQHNMFGRTSTGTLMVCSTAPGDDRFRWRAA
ncbi:hypothetical protein [Yinghuangia seranimata]|uniref:hypothetical protein n=1 Tax=Yinghuangia seranimata TaxID=408067 RepID=UPI00248C3420|nr:hypothetical protein [Yinghuangia seranimata]MDI2128595.1 hypothetical protein [Yinghuangia seranimata]